MAMLRMLLEIVLVLSLVGGLFYVSKVMAKENRSNNENESS